ncbi:MAG: metalloprotease, partial [Isosphaeraceae bacterium]
VHEMGHALTNRLFGLRSVVVLHGLGGVCGTEDKPIASWKRVMVLFNGPAAGFVLAAMVYALATASVQGVLPAAISINSPVQKEIINNLLFINLVWGVLNLIPIWPLDGGQIIGVLLKKISKWRGQEFMHGLSMLVAAGLGVWLYQRNGDVYNIFLLGLITMQNFQMLQYLHARHSQFNDEDDQWWRR